jgi:hypothetical protein
LRLVCLHLLALRRVLLINDRLLWLGVYRLLVNLRLSVYRLLVDLLLDRLRLLDGLGLLYRLLLNHLHRLLMDGLLDLLNRLLLNRLLRLSLRRRQSDRLLKAYGLNRLLLNRLLLNGLSLLRRGLEDDDASLRLVGHFGWFLYWLRFKGCLLFHRRLTALVRKSIRLGMLVRCRVETFGHNHGSVHYERSLYEGLRGG